MSVVDESVWDEINIAGIQLAIFEIVWGGYDEIVEIWLDLHGRVLSVCAVTGTVSGLSKEVFNRFQQQMQEILGVVFERRGMEFTYSTRSQSRELAGIEIMSARIFREIATRQAPWRLANGDSQN